MIRVAASDWVSRIAAARDSGLGYFDFLTAVDDAPGLRLVVRLADPGGMTTLVLSTLLPGVVADSVAHLYPGANWHERETAEMFGILFVGHPGLDPLLLPPDFAGHPLRKDFVLAARAVRPWPGAAGEAGDEAIRSGGRRRVPPPGIPAGWEVPDGG